MTPADKARKIQKLARAAEGIRVAIHLTGSAALFTVGWQRGADAILIGVALLGPNIVFGMLLLRYGGERRSYSQYIRLSPAFAAHAIAAATRRRLDAPQGHIQDGLWWLSGYIQNITLSLAVAFAVDALGGPLPLALAGVLAMLSLTGVANALDLRMRMLDALLTFTIAAARHPEGPADAPAGPAGGN